MSDDLIAYAIEQMKRHGIALSGDAESLGLGAMSDARWGEFFDTMAREGLYAENLSYREAYTLDFVNKRHGLNAGEVVAAP